MKLYAAFALAICATDVRAQDVTGLGERISCATFLDIYYENIPTSEATRSYLMGLLDATAAHHGVTFGGNLVEARRKIANRCLRHRLTPLSQVLVEEVDAGLFE